MSDDPGKSMRAMLHRIVCGVRHEDVRQLLLTHSSLSLKEAEDFAISAEGTTENAQHMQKLPSQEADN